MKTITIDGEKLEVDDVSVVGYLPMVSIGEREYIVAESKKVAGEASKEYWRDMAENDQGEFVCIVGKDNLINWALGKGAMPSSVLVNSLEEWFDLIATCPEETWACHDSYEHDVDGCSRELVDELGFIPTVVYRQN